MAVYVDNMQIEWRGKKWCHLVADSIDELHVFAKNLGLRQEWFQYSASYPHYDVTVAIRQKALKLGATEGTKRKIIECARLLKIELQASNLENTPF
jgi:hypothetical protein